VNSLGKLAPGQTTCDCFDFDQKPNNFLIYQSVSSKSS